MFLGCDAVAGLLELAMFFKGQQMRVFSVREVSLKFSWRVDGQKLRFSSTVPNFIALKISGSVVESRPMAFAQQPPSMLKIPEELWGLGWWPDLMYGKQGINREWINKVWIVYKTNNMDIILFLSNRNLFNKHKYPIYKTQYCVLYIVC